MKAWVFVLLCLAAALSVLAERKPNPVALLAGGEGRVFLVSPTGETTWERKVEGRVARVGSLGGKVYWETSAGLGRVDVVSGRVDTPSASDAEKAFGGRQGKHDAAKLLANVGLRSEDLTAPVFQQILYMWPNGTCVHVPPADVARMRAGALGAGLAKPLRPRKVLVVSRSHGYGHVHALAWGSRGFAVAAEATGAFAATVSDDVSVLADSAKLAAYDAVVVNNCTGLGKSNCPGVEEALTGHCRNGGGVVFLHSAADAFFDCPKVLEMLGGVFFGHPWHLGKWRFRNEIPAHPLNAPFAGEPVFHAVDEIYMQKSPPYDRSKTKVILSLDMSDRPTADAAERWSKNPAVKDRFPLRADGDYAVSWLHPYGKGRVFHTSFGHDEKAFLDPRVFAHILLGVQYAAGDAR